MDTGTPDPNRRIARAAGAVMAAFILSNLAGLAYQVLAARAFGTSAQMEAYNAANRVAETLFVLVAGGALGSAFIPVFTRLRVQGDFRGAWRLASAAANLAALVAILGGLLAGIFAPQLVRYVLAPGFAARPGLEALTIELTRWMLPTAAIFALSGLVMALLNAHQVFFIPALTPALYRLGLIVGVMFLSPRFGIYGLAWGALIGAGLHLALQLPPLLRLGGSYTPAFGLDQPAVREVAVLMGPRLLGVAVVQLNFWVNTNLASQMTPGSVAALGAAFALMLMPQAALAQSVATAAMPTLAAQAALGKRNELRSTLAASLRGVLLLAAPATAGLALLAAPITALIYQRGAFDARSTELVAWALLWYGLGLLGHSVVELLARAFYALSDTRTPVLVGGLAMGLNLLFSILLARVFVRIGWLPVGGLALANSLATALEAAVLLYLMRRRLEGLEGWRVLGGFAAAAAASLAMAAALLGWLAAGQALPLWLQGLVGIPLGGAVFAVAALVLRIPEARQAVGFLRRRLRRGG